MLSLTEIKGHYPDALQVFSRFILREYLQHKILESIFDSPFAPKLAFLGGTCLRIVHGNMRFSEDLDFDNFDLKEAEFEEITRIVRNDLEKMGYETEFRSISRCAFHCYICFPGLLYREGLSELQGEKILIRLDTEPQAYSFAVEKPIINKFDVFTRINTTPLSLLLSQKCYTILNRKRNKGRDFFDVVFLLGKGVLPDYGYLEIKAGVTTSSRLRQRLLDKCMELNMEEMAVDVQPFLFRAEDRKKVLLFPEYIREARLE
jgi:predicted nucleotidyltransferase component of viral defense system